MRAHRAAHLARSTVGVVVGRRDRPQQVADRVRRVRRFPYQGFAAELGVPSEAVPYPPWVRRYRHCFRCRYSSPFTTRSCCLANQLDDPIGTLPPTRRVSSRRGGDFWQSFAAKAKVELHSPPSLAEYERLRSTCVGMYLCTTSPTPSKRRVSASPPKRCSPTWTTEFLARCTAIEPALRSSQRLVSLQGSPSRAHGQLSRSVGQGSMRSTATGRGHSVRCNTRVRWSIRCSAPSKVYPVRATALRVVAQTGSR